MIQIRKNSDRGTADYGWLHAKYSFSFGEYYDPKFMGFRKLRVINEDKVEPGQGFPTHAHKNMEIITYILSGSLEHKDSLGTGSVIYPGEVQLMSAGNGIRHSEYNHSKSELVHLLQIWIEPNINNEEPLYQQQDFKNKNEKFILLVSPNGERNSLKIKQDIKLYQGNLEINESLKYKVEKERHAWIQIAHGEMILDEQIYLEQGDGVAISDGDILNFSTNNSQCQFLLFDLP
ncbi:pirin family protein [Silvanigrella sp.]|jgi:redox-sensitive bicupin YhaK (pirin superfamily)|uniref:pirin family protein n=1 Tax=Silvanigrella sp. TaxID=2024976 RepID=UPI0037C9B3EC